MERSSSVLVVGGTGYLGKRFVRASLTAGHRTYVLHRPEIGMDIDKAQMLLSHKKEGAILVHGSFGDHQSLVDAVRNADVVICPISGVHHRSHEILLQLKLVDAIKEAGNVKRFIPSEFGSDPLYNMQHCTNPAKVAFEDKMAVRKAIEEAGIPFTYILGNCTMGYFVSGLCQPGTLFPSRDSVCLHGDGNVKAIFVEEDDVAAYTIKCVDDPRTLNTTLVIRPPENTLSQREVVGMYIGKELKKTSISKEGLLASMRDQPLAIQVGMGHYDNVFHDGCLCLELENQHLEATELYPEIQYTRVQEYLKAFV
ncbi:hypothetical protein Taro_032023 [Colocasia esculenta]|uniref:(+)-lariciresinol reductase n=1 Tax=Colocasia esculenta TaxID=4460 RepID=A0A843VQC4_COLES|nr:hypothetical protein [Colocasia esculenta]